MRLGILLAATIVEGCCCRAIDVRRVDGTGCWIDTYNCQVSALTRIGSTPCPPDVVCELTTCTSHGDCADAGASCGAALMCGGGTVFGGGTVACSVTDGGGGGTCVLTQGSPGC